MDNRITWALDVNGVLCAPHIGDNWGRTKESKVPCNGKTFRLVWPPELLARVAELTEVPHLSIAWCSSWCPWADILEELWGLPRLPRMLSEDRNRDQAVWSQTAVTLKQEAVWRVLEGGSHLIWADDRAVPLEGPLRQELERTSSLALRPDSRVGLIPGHLNLIERYINGIGAQEL